MKRSPYTVIFGGEDLIYGGASNEFFGSHGAEEFCGGSCNDVLTSGSLISGGSDKLDGGSYCDLFAIEDFQKVRDMKTTIASIDNSDTIGALNMTRNGIDATPIVGDLADFAQDMVERFLGLDEALTAENQTVYAPKKHASTKKGFDPTKDMLMLGFISQADATLLLESVN